MALIPFFGEKGASREVSTDIARVFGVSAELVFLGGEHEIFLFVAGITSPDPFVGIEPSGRARKFGGGFFPECEGLFGLLGLDPGITLGEKGHPEVARLRVGSDEFGEGGGRFGELP